LWQNCITHRPDSMAKQDVRGAQRNIHKRNLIYHTLYPYSRLFFFHYYSEVEITGRERIPRNEPVIFAPNHQNALMDALIVLFSAPGDVVFLARADIFRKKTLAFLLNSLKILPVFRQRDGAAELGKNQEIFDITVDVLNQKHYLCIMPEGNHGDQRKLRQLVKGIFRIAFKAQEPYGDKPFVKLVPVGIDLGHYVKQHQTLLVNYGNPIEISDYWEQYQENPARGINAVRDRLATEMKPLMIHIGTDDYYEAVMGLRKVFNARMREIMGIEGKKLSDRFRADKEMIDRFHRAIEEDEDRVREVAGKVDRYFEGVKGSNTRDWVVRDRGYGFWRTLWRYLTLVITFPVFLYGLVNNAIPYFVPVRLVRNIKDLQFHSSVKAGLGLVIIFPLCYLLQTLLVGILTGPWWIWAAYLVSLFPAGKVALYWYFRWKKTVHGSRFRRKLRRRDPGATELVALRQEIITGTENLVGTAN
jgi:1-acyl-sn-glycerol-3-phosphate acyltransferase